MTCNFLPCIYWKSWLSVGSVWFSNTWWICCGGWSLQWRKYTPVDIDHWWRNRASFERNHASFLDLSLPFECSEFPCEITASFGFKCSDPHGLSSASFFHDGLLGWFVWLMLILNQCNLPKKGTLAFYLYSQYVSIHLVLIIHTDRIYIMYSIFEIRYVWDAHSMEAFLKTRSDLSFWLWHGFEVLLSLLHSTCVSLDGRNQCGRVGLSSEKRHRCFGVSTKQNSDLDPGNKR